MRKGTRPHLARLEPPLACPGAVVAACGSRLFDPSDAVPAVLVGGHEARIVSASSTRVVFRVPAEAEGGASPVSLSTTGDEGLVLDVGRSLVTGIHQVDSPVFDARGRLYVTVSGGRGEQAPVSVFRVAPGGVREPFASGIVNATSMAIGPDGLLYVTSRFEGTVFRVSERGEPSQVASEVGVACGLAFGSDGTMFVGDRSGTLFRMIPGEQPTLLATLPASIAAYHLAVGPDGWIYVSVPTLGSCDNVFRVNAEGRVEVAWSGFGRPQGLAFDATGVLHVVEALAGLSGVYRLQPGRGPELVATGQGLVGVTFDPRGGLVVASNDTVYGFGHPAAGSATSH